MEKFWPQLAPDADLALTETFRRLAGEVADLGFWRMDVASGNITCSDALFRLYGLSRADFADVQSAMRAIHPEDSERVERLLRRAVDLGEDYATQIRLRHADGSWRVLSCRAVCERGPGGEVAVILGVAMDVTEAECYRALANDGNDMIVQTDLAGKITYISPSALTVTGYAPEEIVGSNMTDHVNAEDLDRLLQASRDALRNPGGGAPGVEYRVFHKNGAVMWLESHPMALMVPGLSTPIGTTGVVRNITERKTAEARLEFSSILLRTQTEQSPYGILLVDETRTIISINKRFFEIAGIEVGNFVGQQSVSLLEPILPLLKNPTRVTDLMRHFADHDREDIRYDIEMSDGRFIDCYSVALHAASGAFLGRSWFFQDVTERKSVLAQALRLARVDELTGLANRGALLEAMQLAIARAKRGEDGFAVLYLDLDRFKDVNDTRGHAVGDELLQAVADRLRANTREVDTVARLGGDEFGVIVANCKDITDAAFLADKLITALGEPFSIQGDVIYSGVSIGIDLCGRKTSDAETALLHADLALYRVKAKGGGGYQFFSRAMDSDVRTRVALAAELREAIGLGQLFLVYQPQVAVSDGRITGVEALVRWRHPTRGLLNPAQFIPVAERMGLIGRLGQWVLDAALAQAKAWIDEGLPPIRMCVNLSALQAKTPRHLETDIIAALVRSGLPPALLELELTESVLMNATREYSRLLERLRAMGVTIAIDDFGTGYSSLDYLRRFPVTRIKIAQTFIDDIETLPGSAAIVKAVIGLAQELGIMTIAEGVERAEQYELLKGWGCAELQGYYLARPLAARKFADLLRAGASLIPKPAFGAYPKAERAREQADLNSVAPLAKAG